MHNGILSYRDFRKLRSVTDLILQRTTEQDGQGEYIFFVEDHAGASSKAGRNAPESGNKDLSFWKRKRTKGVFQERFCSNVVIC